MRSYPTTGFQLDKRRELKDNTYPLKLRVTFQRKSKYFKIDIGMTEEEYKAIVKNHRPRGANKAKKDFLNSILQKADTVIKKMKHFSFEDFENEFYQKRDDSENAVFYFLKKIDEFKKNAQISSYENYKSSLNKIYFTIKPAKSIHQQINIIKTRSFEKIPFSMLDEKELHSLKNKWIEQGLSAASRGIYFRNLKAVFNMAINEKKISNEIYPFGRRKFQIQESSKVKKFLELDELKKLKEYKIESGSPLEMSKDFWFLSFYLYGMNINDLLKLRLNNYEGNHINSVRGKTRNTSVNIQEKTKLVIPDAKAIIEKYKNQNPKSQSDYLFPILDEKDDAFAQKHKIKIFTLRVNRHMKRICDDLKLGKTVTTYFARHTFASLAAENHYPLSVIQEALDHTSIITTQRYISSIRPSFGEEFYKKIFQ